MAQPSTSLLLISLFILTSLQPIVAAAKSEIGLGVARGASHPGSAIKQTEVVPLLDYTSDKANDSGSTSFFARTVLGVPEFGAKWSINSKLSLSGIAVIEHERKKTDSTALNTSQLAAKDRSMSVGALLEYHTDIGPLPVAMLLRARARNGDHDGLIIDQRTTVGVYQDKRVSAQFFGQLSYWDTDATRSDFALQDNSNVVNLAGGIGQVSFGVQSTLALGVNWRLMLSVERKSLQGDAKRSPIAEQDSVSEVIAGITYTF